MINSSLPVNNVLDLNKSSLSSAKEDKKATKGRGFVDELVEKQKKLKKKDDDVAPVQQSKSDRQDKKIDKDEKSNSSKSENKDKKISATAGEKSQPLEQGAPAGQKVVEAKASEVASQAEDASSLIDMVDILSGGVASSENNSADIAKNFNGPLSIEGFQMVEPEVVTTEGSDSAAPDKAALEALKNMVASQEAVKGKGDSHLKDMMSKKEHGDKGEMSLSDLLSTTPAGVKENPHTGFATMLKAQSAESLESIRQSNVDNIVSQARTILKDGGGEMQVVLNPDGLGKVDLKVAVENGQVNVEINTQDKQVKKLFDDSILDIRHALEGHNLKVDTLKVGISENFDSQQQMSQGQMDMMERDFARDFMGQFRDERQGFRTANIADGLNSPQMNKNQPEGLKPAARPVAGNGRLNVVA